MRPNCKLSCGRLVSLPSMLRPFNSERQGSRVQYALCYYAVELVELCAGVCPRAQRRTSYWGQRPIAFARASLRLLGADHRVR